MIVSTLAYFLRTPIFVARLLLSVYGFRTARVSPDSARTITFIKLITSPQKIPGAKNPLFVASDTFTRGPKMTQPSTPPILSELRNASSPATQIKALRDLKNEIIGHEEKKRHWIGLGIVSPLVRILNSHRGTGKKKHRELNGSTSPLKPRSIRSEEEDARLQAIIIIGSLASGQYMKPPL